ncbi:unnamed protein product [Lasius platythorax]|uniref:Uncharacterized protein n=1 Tax=Lasius platythorax TaxID=488582 RepID=A0AAV2MZF2_9HYME
MVRSQRSGRIRQLRRLIKSLHAVANFIPPAGYYADLLEDFNRLTGHSSAPEIECEVIYERIKIRQKPRILKIEVIQPKLRIVIKRKPEVITID